MSLAQPSRADDFVAPFDAPNHIYGIFDPFPRTYGAGYEKSPYLEWRARAELGLATAPDAIANQPCYVYQGPRLVLFPCPGYVVGGRYAAVDAPEVVSGPVAADYAAYRHHWGHRGGPYIVRRRY